MNRRAAKLTGGLVSVIGFAIAAVAIALPIGNLLLKSITVEHALSMDAYRAAFDGRNLAGLAKNTLLVAGLATLFAATLAIPLAIVLGRSNLPLRTPLVALLVAPFIVPPYVTALTWVYLIGNGGLLTPLMKSVFGIEDNVFLIGGEIASAVLLAMTLFPLLLLISLAALHRADPSAEEAARLRMSRWGVLWHVTLPAARSRLLMGALLIFVLALTTFDVPAMLQVQAYSVEILTEFNYTYDARRATALAMPLVGTSLLCVFAARTLWNRTTRRERSNAPSPPLFVFRRVPLALLLPIAIVALVTVLPFSVLLNQTGGIDAFDTMARTAGDDFLLGRPGRGACGAVHDVRGDRSRTLVALWAQVAAPDRGLGRAHPAGLAAEPGRRRDDRSVQSPGLLARSHLRYAVDLGRRIDGAVPALCNVDRPQCVAASPRTFA